MKDKGKTKAQLIQELVLLRKHASELETKLLQAQKIEAVERLAGGITHDFNNMMTVVTGYSEMLMRRLGDKHSLFKPVQEIKKAGEHPAELTRQILAFSSQQILQPRLLDLNAVLKEMDVMVRGVIPEDIELEVIPASVLWWVKADLTQIKQVIMNLVFNACDAMSQGGKLTVKTANAELDEGGAIRTTDVQPGAYVMLAISDTGTGMDEETRDRIFDSFFTTKGKEKGTGMGLASVHGIIKQSRGHIFLSSEPGKGSVFNIYLPRAAIDGELLRPGVMPGKSLQANATILLVEDEDSVRELVFDVLRENDYTVLMAGSASEALQIHEVHGGPIHLMVTDMVMPQMSGKELFERLGPMQPEMKVLYMSGYSEEVMNPNGDLDPNTTFLGKPFSAKDLLRKVVQLLDSA